MFGRKGLFGHRSDRSVIERRVPFETAGSGRFVRNAVTRGVGSVPLYEIVSTIRRSEQAYGRESLTNLERWIAETHDLEAYAFHQGGFDYYLSHVEGPERWADAFAGLFAMEREDAAAVLRQAIEIYLSPNHGTDITQNTRLHLDKIYKLDEHFAKLIPDFEEALMTFIDRFYPFSSGS